MQTVDEGIYISIDDNPAYGKRELQEQDNGYELCDLPNSSTQEPVYDN